MITPLSTATAGAAENFRSVSESLSSLSSVRPLCVWPRSKLHDAVRVLGGRWAIYRCRRSLQAHQLAAAGDIYKRTAETEPGGMDHRQAGEIDQTRILVVLTVSLLR